jgi:hypothetical protein
MCPSPPAVLWPPPQPHPRTTIANDKASPGSLSQLLVSVWPGRPGQSSHWSLYGRRVRLCRWAVRNEGSGGGRRYVKANAESLVLSSVLAALIGSQRRTWVGGLDAAQTSWMVGLARDRDGRFLLRRRRLAGWLSVVEVLLGKRHGVSGHGVAPDCRRNLRLDGGGTATSRGSAPAQGIA